MRHFTWLLAVLLAGCAASRVDPPTAGALLMTNYPIAQNLRPTTSESVFLGNLDATISELDKRIDSGQATSAALASALLLRFRIVGRLADGERALALANTSGDAPQALLARAAVQMAFHDFAGAQASIAALERFAEAASQARVLRRDLQMALGNYDLLAEDFRQADQPTADFYELTHRADIRLMQGDLDGATSWYRAAQDLYGDVSPFPLAWLYTQQGIAILRRGDFASAKPFFAAAVERLPSYYLASEHLAECEAELGELDSARDRYRAVIAQTGNPEFYAALAEVEKRAGNELAAARALEAARSGYDDLLSRHRLAYAQHAAEFFIADGQAQRGLALARENTALRKDIGSWILLATAAEAAGDRTQACEATAAAQAIGLNPPEMAELQALREVCR